MAAFWNFTQDGVDRQTVASLERAFQGLRIASEMRYQLRRAVTSNYSVLSGFRTRVLGSTAQWTTTERLLASEPGTVCLAVCACLGASYTPEASATVLYELLLAMKLSESLPSHEQLTHIITLCAPLSKSLQFTERFARALLLAGPASPRFLGPYHRPASPRALAEVIATLLLLSRNEERETKNAPTTVSFSHFSLTGGQDGLWLSTLWISLFKHGVGWQIFDRSRELIFTTVWPHSKTGAVTLIIADTDAPLGQGPLAKYEDHVSSREIDITFRGGGLRTEQQKHGLTSSTERTTLTTGRVLGHGANGPVLAASANDHCFALKQIRLPRNATKQILREFEILNRLKHMHLIEVAGSYYQGSYFGLLTEPMAQCDLGRLLTLVDNPNAPIENVVEDLAECRLTYKAFQDIIGFENTRLWTLFGCLASALAYLHERKVKHKDIKPSNILISHNGVWLTDFGASRDFSDDLTSTSESRERGTLRYCAPEVVNWEESGRSADIFSLGCVYLELLVAITPTTNLQDLRDLCPARNRSYEANLDRKDDWLTLTKWPKNQRLLVVIRDMLSHDKDARPSAADIRTRLKIFVYGDKPGWRALCGECCES